MWLVLLGWYHTGHRGAAGGLLQLGSGPQGQGLVGKTEAVPKSPVYQEGGLTVPGS